MAIEVPRRLSHEELQKIPPEVIQRARMVTMEEIQAGYGGKPANFECFFNFLGWWQWSLGLHVDLRHPHMDLHVPFGFLRIGWNRLRVGLKARTFGRKAQWIGE